MMNHNDPGRLVDSLHFLIDYHQSIEDDSILMYFLVRFRNEYRRNKAVFLVSLKNLGYSWNSVNFNKNPRKWKRGQVSNFVSFLEAGRICV